MSGRNTKDTGPAQKADQKAVQKLLNAETDNAAQKVLGMHWETTSDKLVFVLKMETNINTLKLNKRFILSKINSIWDPPGCLSPFTVKAKILLRKVWSFEPKMTIIGQQYQFLAKNGHF